MEHGTLGRRSEIGSGETGGQVLTRKDIAGRSPQMLTRRKTPQSINQRIGETINHCYSFQTRSIPGCKIWHTCVLFL